MPPGPAICSEAQGATIGNHLIHILLRGLKRLQSGSFHTAMQHFVRRVHYFQIRSAYTSEQADALVRGKLAAGIVILPVPEERLSCDGLYRERLLLALPERHPLAAKIEVELEDLNRLPLVTIRGDIEPRFGEALTRVFASTRTKPRIFHEATTQAEALSLVAEGTAAALVLPSATHPKPTTIAFRRFADDLLTAEMGLAYLGERGSPVLRSVRKFLLETFQPLGGDGLRDHRVRQMALF